MISCDCDMQSRKKAIKEMKTMKTRRDTGTKSSIRALSLRSLSLLVVLV